MSLRDRGRGAGARAPAAAPGGVGGAAPARVPPRKDGNASVAAVVLRILLAGCLFGLVMGAAAVYWLVPSTEMAKVRRSVSRLRHTFENRTGVHVSVRMAEGELGGLMHAHNRMLEVGALAKASSAIVYEHIHGLWRSNLAKPRVAADPRAIPPESSGDGGTSPSFNNVGATPQGKRAALSRRYETMKKDSTSSTLCAAKSLIANLVLLDTAWPLGRRNIDQTEGNLFLNHERERVASDEKLADIGRKS